MSELNFTKSSGRIVKEDGSYINIGDLYDSINDLTNKMSNILDTAFDPINKGFKNISTDHSNIHKGIAYMTNLHIDNLQAQNKKIYRIQAPLIKYTHFKNFRITSEGATIKINLIKDVTITSLGADLDAINNLNHNSNIDADTKFFENSTYTNGTIWREIFIYADTSGTGPNVLRITGEFFETEYLEHITKNNNENYIIEVENIDVKDNIALNISIDIFFYESPIGFVEGAE